MRPRGHVEHRGPRELEQELGLCVLFCDDSCDCPDDALCPDPDALPEGTQGYCYFE